MILKLAIRNIWRNKKRSLITIVSILVAVFLSVFTRSMQLGMYSQMIDNVVESYTGHFQISSADYWEEKSMDNSIEIDNELISKIKKIKGVKAVAPRLNSGALASVGRFSKAVFINGVLPENEQNIKDISHRVIKGRVFEKGKNEIVLAKGIAKYFKLKVGDSMVLIGQGYHGVSAAGEYKVCGIADFKNPNLNKLLAMMHLQDLQTFSGAEKLVSNVVVTKTKKAKESNIKKSISALLLNNLEVKDWHETMPELDQAIKADSVGGLLMLGILYMIISFGIFGTVLMMTQERMYELGVLMAIGMKRFKMSLMLFLETIILSVLGVISGFLFSIPVSYYYNINPLKLDKNGAEAMEKFGFNSTIPFSTDISIPLTHGGIILIITLLISLYPIITIFKLNPIKAMKK